jgi:hypothetical protein
VAHFVRQDKRERAQLNEYESNILDMLLRQFGVSIRRAGHSATPKPFWIGYDDIGRERVGGFRRCFFQENKPLAMRPEFNQ